VEDEEAFGQKEELVKPPVSGDQKLLKSGVNFSKA